MNCAGVNIPHRRGSATQELPVNIGPDVVIFSISVVLTKPRGRGQHQACVLQMNKNWYTNESVWSVSFFYPDFQEDLEKQKQNKKSIVRRLAHWTV